MVKINGIVTCSIINSQEIRFFVADEKDEIQRHHNSGSFYEPEELSIISEFFPRGGVFVDIGANVGNHTIYVSKFLHPTQAILFEPNPPAIEILKINIALNNLQRVVDLSHLGIGLSDKPARAHTIVPPGNLGGTMLHITDAPDGLPLIRGDDVLLQRRVDFIKLDVEGMETRVLEGLSGTVSKWRPSMFIEVNEHNTGKSHEWIKAQDYVVARRYRRYDSSENYMIVPIERAEGRAV